MFAFLKSMFAGEPDRYVVLKLQGRSGIGKVHFPVDMEAIFGDLPRLINPDGVDDTDKIRAAIVEAYPCSDDFPNQTSNRRNLYMSIHTLRQSEGGWVNDKYATKVAPKPRVLSLSVA